MGNSLFKRYLTALLALCTVLSMLAPAAAFAVETEAPAQEQALETQSETLTEDGEPEITDFQTFLASLKVLEGYAASYAAANSGEDAVELVINYIRTGVEKYTTSSWQTMAGAEKTAFVNYVAEQDTANGTTAAALRNLNEFVTPNGQTVEFGHMFGAMNMAYYNANNADLGGWAGDLSDLVIYTKDDGVTGTVEEMVALVRDSYLGIDHEDISSFGILDIYGDLDAYYLVDCVKSGSVLSAVMEGYYTDALTDSDRAVYFLNDRFAGVLTRDEVRTAIYNAYANNIGVQMLEAEGGITAEHEDLRMACCYAFADYLFELAEGRLDGPAEEEPTDPTEPTEPEEEEPADNPYYSVFSSTESTLAPGITQTIKYAYTADDKQIVYYLATVDVTRDDVTVMANYRNNDPGQGWGMQRVVDQAVAMQESHSDPTSDKYVENFQVVVAINADGFNMSTGEPGGLLVMEGVEWHGVDGDGFFAILKDGTAMIGTKADYETYKDQIQEAVGGFGATLVKDGQISINRTENYYTSRASRTAIGITAEGKVVMMVLDGRQEPVSAGGSMEEIAQIMLDAGCVEAINLDGGGSTTFAAKPEGSDEIVCVNRPSDGYERSVSTSLVAVSTALVSNEFSYATISSDYDYLTLGTSLELTAIGVSASGHAAQIPENAVWQVSDPAVGTVENGVFTAAAHGDVDVQLVVDGTVVGSKTLHVVVPDAIAFDKSTMNVICGVETEIPVSISYNGNPVKFNENDVLLFPEYDEAGTFNGQVFTGNEETSLRVVTVCALLLLEDSELYTFMTLNLYKAGEAIFEFEDATAGDRTLAWNRDVSNATTEDEVVYHVTDPDETMGITYVFGLDMEAISIPEQLADLTYMLPGADVEGASAWSFLLQLAERVSVLTEVKVVAQFDPDLDVDISGLTLANDYFTLSSAELDEQTNTLTITANWIDQTQAIDPATANPICILSGIKATPKEGASWDDANRLAITNTGDVTYDIYLRASQLYSFSSSPANQEKYGLYPFENPDVIIGGTTEKGGHFSSTYATFEDSFILDKTNRQGWYSDGNNLFYYVDNQVLTGIHQVPGYDDPENVYYYSFAADGASDGKVTGLFELNGELYYAVAGALRTGWQTVAAATGDLVYYYFDPATGAAVDGVQTIDGYTYTFTDRVLTRGHLVVDSTGTRYRWAGAWVTLDWVEIDGREAYAYYAGYFMTGLWKRYYTDGELYYFAFGEDGYWMKDYSGLYDYNGETYLIEDGYVVEYAGLVKIGEYYYYFTSKDTMIKDCTYWISKPNGIVPNGRYTFDAQGRMVMDGVDTPADPDVPGDTTKNGIVKETDEIWYYYVDGVKTYAGLIIIDGDYYYVNSKCQVVHDCEYWISKNNGLMKNQMYTFDSEGKMVLDTEEPVEPPVTEPTEPSEPETEVLNGIVKVNDDEWYYYVDGVKTYAGLIVIDGDYYYVNSKCMVVHDCDYWISKNNGLMKNQMYTFDSEGKMVLDTEDPVEPPVTEPTEPSEPETEVLNGIVKVNDDEWYYYVDGVKTYAGLIIIDGYYYYVNSKCMVVHDCEYWISKNNGYLRNQMYTFDAEGRMVDVIPTV